MTVLSPSNNEIVEGPPLYWLNVILAESMFPRLIVLEPFPSISEWCPSTIRSSLHVPPLSILILKSLYVFDFEESFSEINAGIVIAPIIQMATSITITFLFIGSSPYLSKFFSLKIVIIYINIISIILYWS